MMNAPQRTFVFGDIHGGLRALEELLPQLELRSEDRLIFLGDYVDGWPDSAALISRLMALEEEHDCIFIRGNHDVWCEGWLCGTVKNDVWLHHGGQATVTSYQALDEEERFLHAGFFGRLRDFFVDERNRLYVHGGFTSIHGPEGERYETSFYWDRTLWETACCLDPAIGIDSPRYPKRLKRYDRIFIGHTPTLYQGEERPMRMANVWNLDTGAAFSGRLTVMEAENGRWWQSRPLPELYPGVTGRKMMR